MSDIKTAYGSNGQTITITLTSLGATSARESTVIDNTSNLFLDALVQVTTKTGAGSPANDKALYVYAYGTVDNGTTYPDTVTGSDAAITLNSPTQLRLIGTLAMPSTATTYKSPPMSVAAAFGGVLPAKWGIVCLNSSTALSATGGDHAVKYQGVYSTVT